MYKACWRKSTLECRETYFKNMKMGLLGGAFDWYLDEPHSLRPCQAHCSS
uniref:Uncharacterized protein n=1 Tax=Anguilla anguilla TaxID=7936 RepID=A0A0E9QQQ4_ANGAN